MTIAVQHGHKATTMHTEILSFEKFLLCISELQIRGELRIIQRYQVKVMVSHSLTDVGAVGVRVPLYLGHS